MQPLDSYFYKSVRVSGLTCLLFHLTISLSFECSLVVRQECNLPLLHIVQRFCMTSANVVPSILDLGRALSSCFGRLRSFVMSPCFSLYSLLSSLRSFQLDFSLDS